MSLPVSLIPAIIPNTVPEGIAFTISELKFIHDWSDRHGVGFEIRLDHGAAGEDYEEVISFRNGMTSACHAIMWRSGKSVYVQPLLGRKQRYASVRSALHTMTTKEAVVITDIAPTGWPK